MIPLLVIVGAIAVLAALSVMLPSLFGRGKPQIGKYGLSGGAVCTNCGRPFPIHLLSFHAGFKHLERCSHCGKWVWVRRANKDELLAAEARWRGEDRVAPAEKEEDRLRRQIDDSRYDG